MHLALQELAKRKEVFIRTHIHNSVRVAIMHKMCSVFRKSACMFGGIPLWTLPVQIESVLWSRANRSACVADSYNAYIPLWACAVYMQRILAYMQGSMCLRIHTSLRFANTYRARCIEYVPSYNTLSNMQECMCLMQECLCLRVNVSFCVSPTPAGRGA